MILTFAEEQYIRNCIRTCQEKKHIQQVALSTYHDAITQICFGCNECRTSISREEIRQNKKGNTQLGELAK